MVESHTDLSRLSEYMRRYVLAFQHSLLPLSVSMEANEGFFTVELCVWWPFEISLGKPTKIDESLPQAPMSKRPQISS